MPPCGQRGPPDCRSPGTSGNRLGFRIGAQHHGLEIRHRYRGTEQIALPGVAIVAFQKLALRLGFDALRNHPKAQAGSQRDDGAGNGGRFDASCFFSISVIGACKK